MHTGGGPALALLGAAVVIGAHPSSPMVTAGYAQDVVAEASPNLTAAGRLDAGALHVALELRMARW